MSVQAHLEEGETVMVEFEFRRSGCLYSLAKVLSILTGPQPVAAAVTDRRVFKVLPKGHVLAVRLEGVERAYWNTASNSFAIVAKDRAESLRLPLVENTQDVHDALRARAIEVEQERMSPRRRFLR